MRGHAGSVLLEALMALVIFMVGTAALVSLARYSAELLARAEMQGRVVPDVAGVPARLEAHPSGELERSDGVLRWEAGGAGVRVEFVPSGWEGPALWWELPVADGAAVAALEGGGSVWEGDG